MREKIKEQKCIFLEEDFIDDWGGIKELILRGYRLLPLASQGVLVLSLNGGKNEKS